MTDLKTAWPAAGNRFAEALLAGAGFSFKFGGQTIGPILPASWQRATSEDRAAGTMTTSWTHPIGLRAIRTMRLMPDFGAVEYQLTFRNVSAETLAPITALKALDVSFGEEVVEDICVVSSGGGVADGFLPPRTFAIRKHKFSPSVADRAIVHLTTEGGRSSNKDLPFFFVENAALESGLFVAFGWSGQWEAFAALHMPETGRLALWGKIPGVEIALEPGEEIVGPTILLGHYQGALNAGSNRLRSLIRERYMPRLSGSAFQPVTTYDHFWHIGDQFDEALLATLGAGAAAIEQEYFLLDAGWYEGASWFPSVGNWEHINAERLPNGLVPVADNIRSHGLEFGLWFEPERVGEGSRLATEHPDWVLWDYGSATTPWLSAAPHILDLYEDRSPDFFKPCGLLNFGLPAVQRWVVEMMSRYISELGVKYIRYDFNIEPLPFWDSNDTPCRRGITQLAHVNGFYSVIDEIRDRHPDVILEGCASGGRRIDLETIRRFHTFWISDYTGDPAIIRYHLYGHNHFLPGSYSYVQYTLPSACEKNPAPDDMGFQNLFGGAWGTGGRVDLWDDSRKAMARRHGAIHKSLRRYLNEDYYPLGKQPADMASWSGWQFHDPSDQSGFIQTFRTQAPEPRFIVKMQGLEVTREYKFTDVYSAESFRKAGADLMANGLEIGQPANSSRVLRYETVSA